MLLFTDYPKRIQEQSLAINITCTIPWSNSMCETSHWENNFNNQMLIHKTLIINFILLWSIKHNTKPIFN